MAENDRKKPDQQPESKEATPSFDEVVRKMLNTPPKPKKMERGKTAKRGEE